MALMGGDSIKKPMGMKGLFNSLYDSKAAQNYKASEIQNMQSALAKSGNVPEMSDYAANMFNTVWDKSRENPLKGKLNVPVGEISMPEGVDIPEELLTKDLETSGLKNTMNVAGANIKAHPFLSAGLGIGGAMNIAGLMDNDKIGGQLVGGVAGYGLPKLLGSTMGPAGMAMATLGGGALGSLYDKLRAKKELEQQQYQGMQEMQY